MGCLLVWPELKLSRALVAHPPSHCYVLNEQQQHTRHKDATNKKLLSRHITTKSWECVVDRLCHDIPHLSLTRKGTANNTKKRSNQDTPFHTTLMPLFLCTLELEGSHFFVGITNKPVALLKEHKGGDGAEWTRLHPPLRFSKKYKMRKLECSYAEGRLLEDARVKVVMLDHGLGSVRGGSYSRPNLSHEDVKALSKELYHGCLRCGHLSHWAHECFASTDVMGNAIEDRGGHLSPSASSRKRKRPSHISPGSCFRP